MGVCVCVCVCVCACAGGKLREVAVSQLSLCIGLALSQICTFYSNSDVHVRGLVIKGITDVQNVRLCKDIFVGVQGMFITITY